MPTLLLYPRIDIHYPWRELIKTGDALSNVERFRYDLVDLTRQVLFFFVFVLFCFFIIVAIFLRDLIEKTRLCYDIASFLVCMQ